MNNERYGNFSSSEIWKLMTNGRAKDTLGAPALTYIKDKAIEKKLGRSIGEFAFSKSTSWGTMVEQRVFELLGIEYSIVSKERLAHPTIENWVGAPDIVTNEIVGDIKCLWLRSFTAIYDINEAEVLKSEYPEYYWQLVSNAILTNKNDAELIIYCPYQSELQSIRELAAMEGIKWIEYATDSELPYLLEGNYYKNIKKIVFTIPEEDKAALTERVIKANEIINNK